MTTDEHALARAPRSGESAEPSASAARRRALDDVRAADVVADALRAGGKLLLFGNGGSAADATHIAAEFVGRFLLERRALPALSLSDNASAMTAIGNDYGYEQRLRPPGARRSARPATSRSGSRRAARSANVVGGARARRATRGLRDGRR